jgi:hypothetical protein
MIVPRTVIDAVTHVATATMTQLKQLREAIYMHMSYDTY